MNVAQKANPSISKASTFGTPWTAAYTTLAIVVLIAIGAVIHRPLLIPPLAATAAYIFGAPGIPGTQPRSVLGGHVLSALLAFALLTLLGPHPWVAVLASGVAFAGMNFVKLFHIPAVATAALVVLLHPANTIGFTVDLVVGSSILSMMGLIVSKIAHDIKYPLYW